MGSQVIDKTATTSADAAVSVDRGPGPASGMLE
jgi:hypothetical protein